MEQHNLGVDEVEVKEDRIGIVTEDELVAQVEAMRDDAEAWGDPVQEPASKRKSERRQRGAMVSVRFLPDELEAVQAQAAAAGESVSGYLRNLAVAASRSSPRTTTWTVAAVTNISSTDESLVLRWVPDPSPWFQGFGLIEQA